MLCDCDRYVGGTRENGGHERELCGGKVEGKERGEPTEEKDDGRRQM